MFKLLLTITSGTTIFVCCVIYSAFNMGKKKPHSANLGKSIIRSRFGKNVNKSGETFLHTSELADGYDWGRLNLQSVTEQSNLDEFLATAELAGTEFAAEKLNVTFVDPVRNSGILSKDELQDVKDAQEKHKELIRIPRRPAWDETTSPEELDSRERQAFLNWRRSLAELQEVKNIHLTPYEKNLEFWRQLWRVIERSDVIVQIVDARNPLLFRCADLETYVKEVHPDKMNLVLINKADYLTESQRKEWADYFKKEGVLVAFWSALDESKKQTDPEVTEEDDVVDICEDISDLEDEESDGNVCTATSDLVYEESTLSESKDNNVSRATMETDSPSDTGAHDVSSPDSDDTKTLNTERSEDRNRTFAHTHTDKCVNQTSDCSCKVLSGEELLEMFRSLHTTRDHDKPHTTVGMVGYPNVGKSSTINAILKMKKVPVSATPGRTKHFQTLIVEEDLMLCDCPGLVFPSFVTTKADLVVNGILPIDQMRDHVPPVSLVCHRISRDSLERTYGINLPRPGECEDENLPPTSEELLNAHGYMRGFMTSRGIPDNPRSSRYILKDYVNGKLLFCHPPPGVDQNEFQKHGHLNKKVEAALEQSCDHGEELPEQVSTVHVPESSIDHEFFKQKKSHIRSKGIHGVSGFARTDASGQHIPSESVAAGTGSLQSLTGKPWKKHNNRNKKEKARRIHSNLDA